MSDFAFWSTLLKFGFAASAIFILVWILRHFDKRLNIDFSETYAVIKSNPLALAVYHAGRFLAIALLIGLLIGCTEAPAGTLFPSKYDHQIQKAVKTYWPDYPDASAWKAQLYQESRLNPNDVSSVGAAGLAQFMPATWDEVTRELRLGSVSPHADVAIQAGAYYQAKMRAHWSKGRSPLDANQLGQASYNAGTGHILKAQSICDGHLWQQISPCLTSVTGKDNAKQTRDYVSRIAAYQAQMVMGM